MSPLRGACSVVGAATFGCGEARGWTEVEITARAVTLALADAGMTLGDVDGLVTASASSFMSSLHLAEHLGVRPRFVDTTMLGGSSFVAHLLHAAMALHLHECNCVVIAYGSTQRTGVSRSEASRARAVLESLPLESAYRPFNPPTAYGLAASRHIHQFGTTRRQLAEVAVAARQWAQRNPEAFMREPLTLDDVLAAPMLADPLSVRDACLVTDGAGALVLVRREEARDHPHPSVNVLGVGMAQSHRQIASMPDLCTTAAVDSGARAYAMAGMGAKDIDMLQLYDAFTINVLLFLEDLGFCAKGEGGPFVADGRLRPGGTLPVNTNGGGLSCVHPGMYGIFGLIEAVRQLRGEAGERQLSRANTALVHGNGGVLSSQATAILGNDTTL